MVLVQMNNTSMCLINIMHCLGTYFPSTMMLSLRFSPTGSEKDLGNESKAEGLVASGRIESRKSGKNRSRSKSKN